MRLPPLNIPDILHWCDDFHARIGRYPTREDGRIVGQLGLRWRAVDACLKCGFRSLPGGSSLARLLLEHRQRRHKGMLPALSLRKILAWLDAYHARTGRWPNADAGKIPEAPRHETFRAVEDALNHGGRGLPGGSSIARLLAERRDVRNRLAAPGSPPEQVLKWADRHRRRTGSWPTRPRRAESPARQGPGDLGHDRRGAAAGHAGPATAGVVGAAAGKAPGGPEPEEPAAAHGENDRAVGEGVPRADRKVAQPHQRRNPGGEGNGDVERGAGRLAAWGAGGCRAGTRFIGC